MHETASQLASRGGSAIRKPYKFSIHDIAKATNKTLSATRKDRQRGKFDPLNLISLAKYIVENASDL